MLMKNTAIKNTYRFNPRSSRTRNDWKARRKDRHQWVMYPDFDLDFYRSEMDGWVEIARLDKRETDFMRFTLDENC